MIALARWVNDRAGALVNDRADALGE